MFEDTKEEKNFPEAYELFQLDIKGIASSKAIRSWYVNNNENNQQLKSSKKLLLDVQDIPRGAYILQVTKQNDKQEDNKLDKIRIILE